MKTQCEQQTVQCLLLYLLFVADKKVPMNGKMSAVQTRHVLAALWNHARRAARRAARARRVSGANPWRPGGTKAEQWWYCDKLMDTLRNSCPEHWKSVSKSCYSCPKLISQADGYTALPRAHNCLQLFTSVPKVPTVGLAQLTVVQLPSLPGGGSLSRGTAFNQWG